MSAVAKGEYIMLHKKNANGKEGGQRDRETAGRNNEGNLTESGGGP